MPKVLSYPNHIKLPLIAKSNLVIKDIQILCDCGVVKANEIRKKYFTWCGANDIKLYDTSLVNTDLFIEFSNEEISVPTVDVERIKKYARMGY